MQTITQLTLWRKAALSTVVYAIVAVLSVSVSSCSEDDEPKIPTITSINPTSAEVGATVTISGTNLDEAIEVKFNGTAATIGAKTATSVTTTVPAGATNGKITVKTPAGEATSAADFTVVVPAPTITSFAPASAEAGEAVTLTGTNLDKVTAVKFGTTTATITSQNATTLVTSVPEGAITGKITVTAATGDVVSATDFTVEASIDVVEISGFEEDNADAAWGKAEDPGDVTVSAIETVENNSFFHLQAKDNNTNYWVGGRYFEVGPSSPFGIEESDKTKVWMNVDVRSLNAKSVGKLVYTVIENGATDNRRNYEIDFDVTWADWKTISIRVDKFGYWNGSGMTDAVTGGVDIPTIWSVALYVQGGNGTDTYDLDFDNLSFSEGGPLGDELEGHH